MSAFVPTADDLAGVLPAAAAPFCSFFLASGQTDNWPAELLAAICWRESAFGTALKPPNPEGTGDSGHGRGLMQIDDRSWGAWLQLRNGLGVPLWQVPKENVAKGSAILTAARLALAAGGLRAQVAAYNAGAGNIRKALTRGVDPDTVTTGGNYSSWVVDKAGTAHITLRGNDPCDCVLCEYLGAVGLGGLGVA